MQNITTKRVEKMSVECRLKSQSVVQGALIRIHVLNFVLIFGFSYTDVTIASLQFKTDSWY